MDRSSAPQCPHNAALVGYTFVRHIGFILDELSAQGLELWQDECTSWQWRWSGTDVQAERGFWALGEAILDKEGSPIAHCCASTTLGCNTVSARYVLAWATKMK